MKLWFLLGLVCALALADEPEDPNWVVTDLEEAQESQETSVAEYDKIAFVLKTPESVKNLGQRQELIYRASNCVSNATIAYQFPFGKPAKHFPKTQKFGTVDGPLTLREIKKRCQTGEQTLEKLKVPGCTSARIAVRRFLKKEGDVYRHQGIDIHPGAKLGMVGTDCSEMPKSDSIVDSLSDLKETFKKFCPDSVIKTEEGWKTDRGDDFKWTTFLCFKRVD